MTATFYCIANGVRVVRARWKGGWYTGTFELSAVKGHDPELEQVRGIIDARQDLADVRFRSAGPNPTVAGWSGLEGNYGALRVAVEALGMRLGGLKVA